MKKKLFILGGVLLSGAPLLALAQVTGGGPRQCGALGSTSTIQGVICKISEILNSLIPLLVILGVIYFIWGVITYVISDDEEAKTSGRNRMIFGVIGLAVIVGVWGLVKIVTNTFGISNVQNINYPTVPY